MNADDLAKRVAIVTGGTQGISEAIKNGRKQRDTAEERVFQTLYDLPASARPAAPPAV